MIKRTDIIGNGRSNELYERQGNNVIACNIPQHGYGYNTLSIIDNQPVTWMKNNRYIPRVPVYCTNQVKERARQLNIGGDWFDVYEHKSRWNSGLHAANHAADYSKEIHLWGFDSMFSDDLTSQMDSLVPRNGRPPLNKHWHPLWQGLFEEHYDTVFVIHAYNECETPLEAQNLRLETHMLETN